jgi:uncharacterized protein
MQPDTEGRSGVPFDEVDEGSHVIEYENDADGEDADGVDDNGADDDLEGEEDVDEDEELEPGQIDAGDGDEEDDEDEDEDEDEEPASAIGDGVGRAAAVLKYIVERIVDEPEKISIGAAEDERGPVLLLKVAEDDRGKVIGRQGRIVQAIRTVVKAATVGTGEKVSVEIID